MIEGGRGVIRENKTQRKKRGKWVVTPTRADNAMISELIGRSNG